MTSSGRPLFWARFMPHSSPPDRPRQTRPKRDAPSDVEWLPELDGADLEVWCVTASLMMFAMRATGLPKGDALLFCNATKEINLPVQMRNVRIRLVSAPNRTARVYKIECDAGVFSLCSNPLLRSWEAELRELPEERLPLLWRAGGDTRSEPSWDELQEEAQKET